METDWDKKTELTNQFGEYELLYFILCFSADSRPKSYYCLNYCIYSLRLLML